MIPTMRPYNARASAKMRIRIIPTNSFGCCAFALILTKKSFESNGHKSEERSYHVHTTESLSYSVSKTQSRQFLTNIASIPNDVMMKSKSTKSLL